ncbi:MAG: aspartate-semialdehyde dehydrogenase [Candidatus Dadabacteria bacterium]|nr:aspartate-semialdehyde dehydrogenase [Candidatus Dadabacteria bacterium]NIQ16237.1 aspartate-semialdehyde dehydrogenase [Candidatus Dadabacteria bacterium]
MNKDKYNVAIVGATGAVGQEMLRILEERDFPVDELRLIASERSAGKKYNFKGKELVVKKLDNNSFENIDIALFSAGSSLSKEFSDSAVKSGAVVIDNSSAFRMDPQVPLVIPEINPNAAKSNNGIIANPNCTTAVTIMALKPLHDLSKIKRVVATSFQAVSGAGAGGISELENQTEKWPDLDNVETDTFPYQIAFNVIPHIDSFTDNDYTKEEMKLHNESRKILEDDSINITATTVRVPVFRAHSVSVNIETKDKITPEQAREAINKFPGIQVVDDPKDLKYPMPIDSSGKDDCFVGRLREDYTIPNGLAFWVTGDQLRKGAALNAVQIAELLIAQND